MWCITDVILPVIFYMNNMNNSNNTTLRKFNISNPGKMSAFYNPMLLD